MKIKALELIKSGLITKAVLARLMYPGNAGARQYLHNKLNGLQGQSFTPDDKKKVENIFTKYLTCVD